MPQEKDGDWVLTLNRWHLVDHINQARTTPNSTAKLGGKTVQLFEKLVMKWYQFPTFLQLLDLSMALSTASSLQIPVQRAVTFVDADEGVGWITERISGHTLRDVWPTLGWAKTIWLAFQLRTSVSRMRKLTRETAGSLVAGHDCTPWLQDDMLGVPHHATLFEYASILNFWANFSNSEDEAMKTELLHAISVFYGPLPLNVIVGKGKFVFTNNCLTPDNLIVGDGRKSQFNIYITK